MGTELVKLENNMVISNKGSIDINMGKLVFNINNNNLNMGKQVINNNNRQISNKDVNSKGFVITVQHDTSSVPELVRGLLLRRFNGQMFT
jgi:hypothetical protein